jgi:hypothetical protein
VEKRRSRLAQLGEIERRKDSEKAGSRARNKLRAIERSGASEVSWWMVSMPRPVIEEESAAI